MIYGGEPWPCVVPHSVPDHAPAAWSDRDDRIEEHNAVEMVDAVAGEIALDYPEGRHVEKGRPIELIDLTINPEIIPDRDAAETLLSLQLSQAMEGEI